MKNGGSSTSLSLARQAPRTLGKGCFGFFSRTYSESPTNFIFRILFIFVIAVGMGILMNIGVDYLLKDTDYDRNATRAERDNTFLKLSDFIAGSTSSIMVYVLFLLTYACTQHAKDQRLGPIRSIQEGEESEGRHYGTVVDLNELDLLEDHDEQNSLSIRRVGTCLGRGCQGFFSRTFSESPVNFFVRLLFIFVIAVGMGILANAVVDFFLRGSNFDRNAITTERDDTNVKFSDLIAGSVDALTVFAFFLLTYKCTKHARERNQEPLSDLLNDEEASGMGMLGDPQHQHDDFLDLLATSDQDRIEPATTKPAWGK